MLNRRQFLKSSAMAAAGLMLPAFVSVASGADPAQSRADSLKMPVYRFHGDKKSGCATSGEFRRFPHKHEPGFPYNL